MARSDRRGQPVSEEALDTMPERISQHFDRVRDLLPGGSYGPDGSEETDE